MLIEVVSVWPASTVYQATGHSKSPMKLYAMGDVSFGDQPLCFGFGVLSKAISNGYEDLFAEVRGLWDEDDIVFANLESVIDLEIPNWTDAFENRINRGMIQAATALQRAGINLGK